MNERKDRGKAITKTAKDGVRNICTLYYVHNDFSHLTAYFVLLEPQEQSFELSTSVLGLHKNIFIYFIHIK